MNLYESQYRLYVTKYNFFEQFEIRVIFSQSNIKDSPQYLFSICLTARNGAII